MAFFIINLCSLVLVQIFLLCLSTRLAFQNRRPKRMGSRIRRHSNRLLAVFQALEASCFWCAHSYIVNNMLALADYVVL